MGSVQINNRVLYRFEIQKALGLQLFLMFQGFGWKAWYFFFKGPIAIEGFWRCTCRHWKRYFLELQISRHLYRWTWWWCFHTFVYICYVHLFRGEICPFFQHICLHWLVRLQAASWFLFQERQVTVIRPRRRMETYSLCHMSSWSSSGWSREWMPLDASWTSFMPPFAEEYECIIPFQPPASEIIVPRIIDIPSSWNDFFFVDFSPVYQRPFFRGFDGGRAAIFFCCVESVNLIPYRTSYFLLNCGQKVVQIFWEFHGIPNIMWY